MIAYELPILNIEGQSKLRCTRVQITDLKQEPKLTAQELTDVKKFTARKIGAQKKLFAKTGAGTWKKKLSAGDKAGCNFRILLEPKLELISDSDFSSSL